MVHINDDPVQAYVKVGEEFIPVDDAGIRQLMRGYATRLGAIQDDEDVYIRLDGEWRLLSKGNKEPAPDTSWVKEVDIRHDKAEE